MNSANADDTTMTTKTDSIVKGGQVVPTLLEEEHGTKSEGVLVRQNEETMITLTHYTETPFTLDLSCQYEVDFHKQYFKPRGLWLSDDSQELNWKTWCEGEDFHLNGLSYKTAVQVNLTDGILHLDGSNARAVVEFQQKYRPAHESYGVDWDAVAQDYKGIFISPYCYETRRKIFRKFKTYWFDGWDVPSACIWDLSCVIKTEPCQKVTDVVDRFSSWR